jgi:hypothetical protein
MLGGNTCRLILRITVKNHTSFQQVSIGSKIGIVESC